MKNKYFLIALVGIVVLLSLVSLASCHSGTAETTVTVSPSSLSTASPSSTMTPAPSATEAGFTIFIPSSTYTPALTPVSDDSDLLTATPILDYRLMPSIQILQDNKIIPAVNGVIKLSYRPFTLRFISHLRTTLLINLSFNNAFQNRSQEGLDPFLPCPNPFCAEDELPTDHQILIVDDEKYNSMKYCLNDPIFEDDWIWNRCQIFKSGVTKAQAWIQEYDLRVFGRLVNGNLETIAVSDLKGTSDRVYITVYAVFINRLDKTIAHDQDQDFDLIKLQLWFE